MGVRYHVGDVVLGAVHHGDREVLAASRGVLARGLGRGDGRASAA